MAFPLQVSFSVLDSYLSFFNLKKDYMFIVYLFPPHDKKVFRLAYTPIAFQFLFGLHEYINEYKSLHFPKVLVHNYN